MSWYRRMPTPEQEAWRSRLVDEANRAAALAYKIDSWIMFAVALALIALVRWLWAGF